MVYERFKWQTAPATLATSATVFGDQAQTVAKVASVAEPVTENQPPVSRSVASVAATGVENGAFVSGTLGPDIAIALERAADRLKSNGCRPHEVWAQARAMVRADLHNDPKLFVRQVDPNRCHVCGGHESLDRPFIPVLSAKPAYPHWLHVACHAEHIRRIDTRVEAIFKEAVPF